MKIVALDVGSKRIGVAVADTSVRIAVPHSTIEVDGTEFAQLVRILRMENSKHLVVGLPRNSQGEESAQSTTVRSFVAALQDYFTKHDLEKPLIKFQDESLTSVKAEENLALNKRKKNRAKGEIDREAATLILQDFLDSFNPEAMAAGEEDPNAKKKSKRKARGFKVFATIVGLLIVAVVGVIVWYSESIKPVNPGNCQSAERCDKVDFVILEGESVADVAESLSNKKLIKNDLMFRAYLKIEKKEKVVKAGVYSLHSGMSVAEIVSTFDKGSDTKVFGMEIKTGDTVSILRDRLIAVGYTEDKVDAALNKQYRHELWGDTDLAVSDFLYADTYIIGVGAQVEDIITLMLDKISVASGDNNLSNLYTAMGLTFKEAYAMAARVRTDVGEISDHAVAEIARAAELVATGDFSGKTDYAVDFNVLIGVAYHESKLPFVPAGDYAGWVEVYGDLAKQVGDANGIPYEAMLAQSILESSWGKSKLAYKYFNFFGIKYVNMPTGSAVAPTGGVNMATWEEYEPGVSTTISADFAAWDSTSKGFSAYAAWIKAQSRYKAALNYPNDPIKYIEELKKGGYATDSNYVATLTSIIESLRAAK
ncbi:MAG: Holliday junction resolvase RuvX [Candidatus Saccharimonadales bacterium]